MHVCIIHMYSYYKHTRRRGEYTAVNVMNMYVDASQYTLIGADRPAFFTLFLSTGDVDNSIIGIRDEGIVSRVGLLFEERSI
jgi:hypothetical protein